MCHKIQLSLILIGLVSAILMLTIGFFRTLLILLFTVPGGAYGYLVDKLGFTEANGAIVKFIKGLKK
ncbi:MAG: DUF2273 domain-containing protein [Clostridia bacterium]|nr:DUF2273 domain-containing protein [Clostridia bacterium]